MAEVKHGSHNGHQSTMPFQSLDEIIVNMILQPVREPLNHLRSVRDRRGNVEIVPHHLLPVSPHSLDAKVIPSHGVLLAFQDF